MASITDPANVRERLSDEKDLYSLLSKKGRISRLFGCIEAQDLVIKRIVDNSRENEPSRKGSEMKSSIVLLCVFLSAWQFRPEPNRRQKIRRRN